MNRNDGATTLNGPFDLVLFVRENNGHRAAVAAAGRGGVFFQDINFGSHLNLVSNVGLPGGKRRTKQPRQITVRGIDRIEKKIQWTSDQCFWEMSHGNARKVVAREDGKHNI